MRIITVKREDLHIRDPFVFVQDGKYYLLGTTGDDCWYKCSDLKLYVSNDLENFEYVCQMLDGGHSIAFTDLNGKRRLTLHQPNVTPDERMKVLDL